MSNYISRSVAFLVNRIRRFSSRAYYASQIRLGRRANLDIVGRFGFGQECVISEGANIIVPKHSELVLGKGCYIGRNVELSPTNYIEIGSGTSIQDRCIIVGDVRVGRYCLFSLNVLISSGRHYYDLYPSWLIKDQDDLVANNTGLNSAHSRPVVVEDDCWLGINSVVMPGITIGKGSVVGANSVVTRDVAPYSVVAGAPATEIKKRLDFAPPKCISHEIQSDWPYFYSGFEISKESLEKYSRYEGVATKDEFVICLDASSGKEIHLIVKNTIQQKCTIAFEGAVREISNQFEEVVFEIAETTKSSSRFHMRTDKCAAPLIIKKAWVV